MGHLVLVAFPPLILKKVEDLGDCFVKVAVKTKYIIQHTTKQSFTVSCIAIVRFIVV